MLDILIPVMEPDMDMLVMLLTHMLAMLDMLQVTPLFLLDPALVLTQSPRDLTL